MSDKPAAREPEDAKTARAKEVRQESSRVSERDGQYPIVCPKCHVQAFQDLQLRSVSQSYTCPRCKTAFTTSVFHIRASQSRSSGIYQHRYTVQVKPASGKEQELTFTTPKKLRIVFHAKDLVGFTSLNNKLAVVQNFTIRKYWVITRESLYVWLLIFTAAAILIVFYYGSHAQ